MPGNNYFQFKQFKIIQEKSAMRVGTDAVLLGAWATVSGAARILDIGTGTGVIAIMLAQRSDAEITGIEIEKNATEEALANVRHSPWPGRLKILHTSFQEIIKSSNEQFDLIVSNPPFFINAKRPYNHNLAIARHSEKLTLHELAKGVDKLMNPDGRLAMILPVFAAKICIPLAEKYELHLSRLTEVQPNEAKPPHRYLMEFCKKSSKLHKESIAIRNASNDDFTEAYKRLTRDYYLKF